MERERWVLELDGKMPVYMVREELQREKIRVRGAKKRFEKKYNKEKGESWQKSVGRK